jgi:thiol-disulfide isomerase/thioredoxin
LFLLAPFCGLVALAGCSDAPELRIVPTNRVVLAEFFTWQRCSYCPYAAHALDSVAREFGDSVVVVAFHRRVAGDTLSPEYVEARRAFYYDGGGEPATVFDGGPPVRTSGPEYNYETFRNYALAAKSVTPKVQLSLDTEMDSAGGEIAVTVSGVDSTPAETLQLFLVLVEDSVRGGLPGATDSVFNRVMRAMLPDENGRSLVLTRNDTLQVHETFGLAPFWHRQLLGAVAFVQEMDTKRVLQAASIRRLANVKGGR